jgi:hypothetical protein
VWWLTQYFFTANKSIWTTFTNGKDADWAVNITTAFSITNTVANIVSGFATDFLWSRVRACRVTRHVPYIPNDVTHDTT